MDSKLGTLLQAAVEKTERGGLVWKAFNDETFRTPVGPGYLHIRRDTTYLGDDAERMPATKYYVNVSDAQGRVVADAEAVEGFESFALFDRVFQAARRSALGSDRVIEDMLLSLRGGVGN